MEKKQKKENKLKKQKNKKIENRISYRTSEQDEMIKFVVVILVVLLSVGAIYLFTRAFITKDLFEKTTETQDVANPGVVNYNVAIMGQLLNRPYKEYYAVIYDSTGDYSVDMYQLVTDYSKVKGHKHVYTIDLANELNKSYYDKENVNKSAKTVEDIKVGDITLIKVSNGKIDKYIVDYAKMQKELGVQKK